MTSQMREKNLKLNSLLWNLGVRVNVLRIIRSHIPSCCVLHGNNTHQGTATLQRELLGNNTNQVRLLHIKEVLRCVRIGKKLTKVIVE